MKILSVEGF